ncbi:Jacalin-like lectin domain [Phytophthora cactorum]|nr:Jacalin-like lectin domain [Phytophthora cactorum]
MPRRTVLQAVAFLLGIATYAASITEAAATHTALDEDIQLSEVYGGPHGDAFSDMAGIKLGQTLSSITIRGDARIDAVSTHVATPAEATWDHGGNGGTATTLILDTNEYIDSMEIHWGKKKTHTRVFYLKFTTSEGDSVSAGTKTDNSATVKAPEGFQLSGFFGRAASEVDQLGVIWTRRSAKAANLNDTMGTGWYGKRIRNWVGPTIGNAKDTACYRQMEPYNSSKVCPAGYSLYDQVDGNCIAECPLAYPSLIYYIRFKQTTAPQGTVEDTLAVAYQSDVVLVDLPVAICHCLGLHVPPTLVFSGIVMMIVEAIVKQAIVNGDDILFSAQNVYNLLHNVSVLNSSRSSVDELQELMDTNSTCGYQLKRLTDHVILSVNDVRNKNSGATINDIRVRISRSSLVLKEIPAATNNCMEELLSYKTKQAAFETRDLLRKTFSVIVDQLVNTATTNKGVFVAEQQYMLEVTNYGLALRSLMKLTIF